MAHFYGSVKGSRKRIHRLGGKSSGVETTAASWQGCINVHTWHDEKTGIDMVSVSKGTWHGAGENKELYRGPIGVEE